MTAWLLPEQLSDALPLEAAALERLRRSLLDLAASHGYELVVPPLLEYVDSLVSGAGQDLDLQTFKLADPMSGRALGLRADMTPQTARIDAHLLNRQGLARLCYCGSVVRSHVPNVYASREPLQFGVELYGHAGLEADLEVQRLAVRSLQLAGCDRVTLVLSDVRIVRGALAGLLLDPATIAALLQALAAKDQPRLQQLLASASAEQRDAVLALTELYGDAAVLDRAAARLPARAPITEALAALRALAQAHAGSGVELQIDLADLRGYHYHSGVIFGLYAGSGSDALARGGRYDEIGAQFGRSRAATGFSLDLRELARQGQLPTPLPAVRADWSSRPGYAQAVQALRAQGRTVIELPAGQALEGARYQFSDHLVERDGSWQLAPLPRG